VDGVNEAGPAGGMLYMPGAAVYQDVASADARTSIASYELPRTPLTSFATVAEARPAYRR
jgi:choloylglycine hydrolase